MTMSETLTPFWARSSDPTLTKHILVYWWRMSTRMVVDKLMMGLDGIARIKLCRMRGMQRFLEGRTCKLGSCIIILYWIIRHELSVHWLHSWQQNFETTGPWGAATMEKTRIAMRSNGLQKQVIPTLPYSTLPYPALPCPRKQKKAP